MYAYEYNTAGALYSVTDYKSNEATMYRYDAWGNYKRTIASGVTALERSIVNTYNPFRYRGYYYDVETGWYYLQTRYYNPTWGRFLNADGVGMLGANGDLQAFNLYAYCSNNPVMDVDPLGTFSLKSLVKAVVAVAVVVTVCAVTAGTAISIIAPTAVFLAKSTMVATIAVGTLAGGVEIANQIIEDGDVTDIEAVEKVTFDAWVQ